jgi:predicted nucleic acid-binding protein
MIDPSKFEKLNVADTCSIWNVLASRVLHGAAKSVQVSFCLTEFVRYECLLKPGRDWPERPELQNRLRREIQTGSVMPCRIEIEDLQDVGILESRKRVSKGELSSIVFAKKSQQAFMTDDKKAANLARTIVPTDKVQSTPHLLAWLFYTGRLQDSDKDLIVSELTGLSRNLQPHLDNAYFEALRCRLMTQTSQGAVVPDLAEKRPLPTRN